MYEDEIDYDDLDLYEDDPYHESYMKGVERFNDELDKAWTEEDY